ncbi:hypothetical protein [Kineococcus terrestris]|uniref:hypothetical protein n=1 Tax=Kineococcus terrestris TaxID=2044856 RepID=UPI0034DB567F
MRAARGPRPAAVAGRVLGALAVLLLGLVCLGWRLDPAQRPVAALGLLVGLLLFDVARRRAGWGAGLAAAALWWLLPVAPGAVQLHVAREDAGATAAAAAVAVLLWLTQVLPVRAAAPLPAVLAAGWAVAAVVTGPSAGAPPWWSAWPAQAVWLSASGTAALWGLALLGGAVLARAPRGLPLLVLLVACAGVLVLDPLPRPGDAVAALPVLAVLASAGLSWLLRLRGGAAVVGLVAALVAAAPLAVVAAGHVADVLVTSG